MLHYSQPVANVYRVDGFEPGDYVETIYAIADGVRVRLRDPSNPSRIIEFTVPSDSAARIGKVLAEASRLADRLRVEAAIRNPRGG